ncbi:hypothetical protein ABH926_007828 [Catenulispora sp. GP43]|uniref:hypothetical protein n=1 Tax=Catenulispora sp. GP43 TaxID=3156263 RepID=UPI003517CDF0
MTFIRTHSYSVAPDDLDEFLEHRASLIATIRASHTGLSEVRLVRLDDGTYTDAWHWDSLEQRDAALSAIATFTDAPAAMALTRDGSRSDGETVDLR